MPKKTKPKGKSKGVAVKHPCVFSLRDIARLRGELESQISIPVTITLDSTGHHNLLIAGQSIGHEDLMASAHARLILGSTLRGLIGALAIIDNHNAHILEVINNERIIEN